MNIYQKLIEVRKEVPYLKKDTEGYKFKYVSSSQALSAVRNKMDELGLLLIPSVRAFEVRDHQTKQGAHEYFTILTVLFTWINAENPEEKIECKWTGQGLDSGEKGVGKACTYAEKYFLLKFFNVATDKDDPDAFQDRIEGKEKPSGKTYRPQQQTINGKPDNLMSEPQRKKIRVLLSQANIEGEDFKAFLKADGMIEESTKELTKKQAIELISNWTDKMKDYQTWLAS
jgi:hypothetical protein